MPGALRLGVFGGTFDPIHVAHLVAAVNARHGARLDRVLLVVANQPWQKAARRLAPAEDRFGMVEAAVAGTPGLEASRIELDRGGPSYTVDTLQQLASEEPSAELFLVVGADVANELDTWRHVGDVQAMATLVVVSRGGAPARPPLAGWRVVDVEIPALAVSSTDIRARVAEGRPLDFLVPDGAVRCLRERGLYAEGR